MQKLNKIITKDITKEEEETFVIVINKMKKNIKEGE